MGPNWRRSVLDAPFPIRELPRRLEGLLEALRQRGHQPNPTSRVAQYIALLDEQLSRTGPITNREELHAHITARLEGGQLEFIHRIVTQPPELAGWADLMAEVVNGPLFPKPEGQDRPRDLQAELLAAASVRWAGLETTLEEPDVVVHSNGIRLGVAVKRPRTLDAVRKKVHEGADQLARAKVAGIVMLDLTLAVSEEQRFWVVDMKDPDATFKVGRQIDSLIATGAAKADLPGLLSSSSKGRFVCGIATITHPALVDHETGRMWTLKKWDNAPLPGRASKARTLYRLLIQRLARQQ